MNDNTKQNKKKTKNKKDRCGIVYSMSDPLTKAGINLLYLSTFKTANVLVNEKFLSQTLEVLDIEETSNIHEINENQDENGSSSSHGSKNSLDDDDILIKLSKSQDKKYDYNNHHTNNNRNMEKIQLTSLTNNKNAMNNNNNNNTVNHNGSLNSMNSNLDNYYYNNSTNTTTAPNNNHVLDYMSYNGVSSNSVSPLSTSTLLNQVNNYEHVNAQYANVMNNISYDGSIDFNLTMTSNNSNNGSANHLPHHMHENNNGIQKHLGLPSMYQQSHSSVSISPTTVTAEPTTPINSHIYITNRSYYNYENKIQSYANNKTNINAINTLTTLASANNNNNNTVDIHRNSSSGNFNTSVNNDNKNGNKLGKLYNSSPSLNCYHNYRQLRGEPIALNEGVYTTGYTFK